MLKMQANLFLSVLLVTLLLKVNAHQEYQTYIPNGDKVPNPCNRSTTWPGVGHQNVYGSGPRNPFGLDFAANNHVWNTILCQMDSDGDGMTNGQELGDPNCTWTIGSNSTFSSTNLTHPGVCEPLGSPLCSAKNSWLMNCMPGKLNCSAVKEPGVQNFTVRFPVTPVPSQETTYICRRFNFPNDTVSDIIAIEPVIDNALVVHHMLLYACANEPTRHPENESFPCGYNSTMSCLSVFAVWGVGIVGQCLNSLLGFRIGPGGYQYAVLQLHWNNQEHLTNLMDSSGMRIYHTTKLRPNQGQVQSVGQEYLEIPPGQQEVALTGSCLSSCTRNMPHSIFLTSSFFHMHRLGKSGDIRLSRNGSLLQILDNVTQYDYNSPKLIEFETPIEVKPGDEIQVNCVYDSTDRNTTTYFGDATSSEMCYGVFAYYPLIEGLSYCVQWKSINFCNDSDHVEHRFCNFDAFEKLMILLAPTLTNPCVQNCISESCSVILDAIESNGCLRDDDVMAYAYFFYPRRIALYEKCAMVMSTTSLPPKLIISSPSTVKSHSSGQDGSIYLGFTITLLVYAFHE